MFKPRLIASRRSIFVGAAFLWGAQFVDCRSPADVLARPQCRLPSDLFFVMDASSRANHIDVRYKFVKVLKKKKIIKLQYCESKKMSADILTKTLPAPRISKLRELVILSGNECCKSATTEVKICDF